MSRVKRPHMAVTVASLERWSKGGAVTENAEQRGLCLCQGGNALFSSWHCFIKAHEEELLWKGPI
jgi:hypothetical protein